MFGHLKLGRRAPIPGLAVPALDAHLKRALPPPPPAVDWGTRVPQFVLGRNDELGDCTIVAGANAIATWTAWNGTSYRVPDTNIVYRYSEVTGYDPVTGVHDDGAIETDVLGAWASEGWDIGLPTPDVVLWAAVDPRDHTAVRQAIHMFGGAYIGLSLPVTAQNQDLWTVVDPKLRGDNAPGSWGGHAVWVYQYDAAGLTCATWGAPQHMSWGFWDAYCDESYALLSRLHWRGPHGDAPNHVDFESLAAALRGMGR